MAFDSKLSHDTSEERSDNANLKKNRETSSARQDHLRFRPFKNTETSSNLGEDRLNNTSYKTSIGYKDFQVETNSGEDNLNRSKRLGFFPHQSEQGHAYMRRRVDDIVYQEIQQAGPSHNDQQAGPSHNDQQAGPSHNDQQANSSDQVEGERQQQIKIFVDKMIERHGKKDRWNSIPPNDIRNAIKNNKLNKQEFKIFADTIRFKKTNGVVTSHEARLIIINASKTYKK